MGVAGTLPELSEWALTSMISNYDLTERECSVWVKNLHFPFIFLFMKSEGANFA